jgi:hypothetical protein
MSHPFLLTLTRKTVVHTHELLAQLPRAAGGDLKNQLQRSSSSVSLNLAEASGRHGRDRRRFLDFATAGHSRGAAPGRPARAWPCSRILAASMRRRCARWTGSGTAVLYRVMRG